MPSTTLFGQRFALMGAFDPRPWAGVAVFSHNGTSITIPADATPFLEVLTFLNGRGVGLTLTQHAAANKTGASVWTIGVDSADKVYIESSTDDFTVTAGTGATAWGFSNAGHGLVGGVAPFRRTATSDWIRGGCGLGEYIRVTPVSSAAFNIVVPGASVLWTNPMQSLVAAGSDPYDGTEGTPGTNDLSSLHRAARGNGNINWTINGSGRVVVSWPQALAGASLTWLSATFMRELGFRGYEPTISTGNIRYMTALDPCPGVTVPTRPAIRLTSHVDGVQSSVRTPTGARVAVQTSTWNTHRLEAYIDGPVDDGGDGVDLVTHYARRCLDRWSEGARVTLYQEWGDTRYARTMLEAAGSYTAYVTPQDNGRRGRRRCFIDKRPAAVGFDGALELRTAPVTFELDEEAV